MTFSTRSYADEIAQANTAVGKGAAYVSIEVARELHGMLRECARADVQGLLSAFGIERVTQLKAADEARARAYVERLQNLPF